MDLRKITDPGIVNSIIGKYKPRTGFHEVPEIQNFEIESSTIKTRPIGVTINSQGIEIDTIGAFLEGVVKITAGIGTDGLPIFNNFNIDSIIDPFGDRQQFDDSFHEVKDRIGTSYAPGYSDAQGSLVNFQELNSSCIEPLAIREIASRSSTYFPNEAHEVWAHLSTANVDILRRSSEVKWNGNTSSPHMTIFIDDQYPGLGAVKWPILIKNLNEDVSNTFSDNVRKNRINLTGITGNIKDSILKNLSLQTYEDFDVIGAGGFIYNMANMVTDSIVYGETYCT